MSQNTPDSFQMQEWDNQPIEQRLGHLEQLIEIQSVKNEEAQKILDKTSSNWVIYRAIRDDMLDSAGLQVKTVALEDIVVLEKWQRFISGGKQIPSSIVGNTKAKRFDNFVSHFARWFDSSVFVQARNRYWIKEEVLACIAWADSDMGNANKSTNNIMNYGNNDRGQTRWYDSVLSSVMGAAHWLSEWKYLSRNNTIWELSWWGRQYLWLQSCSVSWQYCYATSPINWRRNVNNCLTFIEWERKDWDNLSFKK